MTVYTEQKESYAFANWTEPTATDNVDLVVNAVSSGPKPGDKFYLDDGIVTVVYTAADEAGNMAIPCSFNIIVDGKSVVFVIIYIVVLYLWQRMLF